MSYPQQDCSYPQRETTPNARIRFMPWDKLSLGNTLSILQAVLVTTLWSSSWVLIKMGLGTLPAFTFAGLRYTLAFLILLPLMMRGDRRRELRKLSIPQFGLLALLGIVYYTLTQGALFLGLDYLPANTLSLVLSLSGITIAFSGRLLLGEHFSWLQWIGVFVSLAGALLYFGTIGAFSAPGLFVALFALLANTASAILGRFVNKDAELSALLVTTVSMGIGAICLLLIGLVTETFPAFQPRDVLIIFWLAGVNTAFTFTLWNHTLRTLTAVESGVINNTMLIQIAVLAWIFLGEKLDGAQIAGLAVAAAGTVLVHTASRRVVEAQAVPEES